MPFWCHRKETPDFQSEVQLMVLVAFTRGKVLVPFIDYYSSLWVGKFSVESCSLFHVAPLKVWKLLIFLRQRLMKTVVSVWTWQASSFVGLPSLTIYIYTAEWKTAREKTCHFKVKGHQQALAHMTGLTTEQSRAGYIHSTLHLALRAVQVVYDALWL